MLIEKGIIPDWILYLKQSDMLVRKNLEENLYKL